MKPHLASPLLTIAALLAAALFAFTPRVLAVESRVVTPQELWSLFEKRPSPFYPYEARRARTTGSGLFRMYVNRDGTVRAVGVMKSTGSKALDLAAAAGLYRSRLKPGRNREVDIPVAFTMTP